MALAVKLFRNQALTAAHTGGQTSTVCEPSLANNGRHILYSGNWFAARSADDGATWTHVNPFTFLPPVDGGFCCDQTVHYDPGRDLTIWLLQYIKANSTNTLRIAFKRGALDAPGAWAWRDLKPIQVDPTWAGEWFDYNHAAFSNNFLYVGTNSFDSSDNHWRRCVIFRIPLDGLVSNEAISIDKFVSTTNFSLRCVQGAKDVMFFASHNTDRQVRVFEWPETATTVTSYDVNVRPWVGGAMSAPVAGAPNWLSRCDSRITGAWLTGGVMGFMWTANRQSSRPFPFVRVVRISASDKRVVDEPDVWRTDAAYAYPEACPNVSGIVGITLFTGGGQIHPSHLVGLRDDAASTWTLTTTAASSHSPSDSKWGDYLTCRRHSPDGLTWVASGYTLSGGGERTNIVPRYVHFGLAGHQPAQARWLGA